MKMGLLQVLGLAAIGLASVQVYARTGGESGGGVGILCGNRLQTLDLYEGEVKRHLVPGPEKGNLEQDLQIYMQKFVNQSRAATKPVTDLNIAMKMLHQFINEKIQFVSHSLPSSGDATLPELTSDCHPVQIAQQEGDKSIFISSYENSFKVQIDESLWLKLEARDQAALIFHELFYSMRRGTGDAQTSDDTRKNVIAIFFQGSEPLLKDIWTAPRHQQCWSKFRVLGPNSEDFREFNDTDWYVSESQMNGVQGLLFSFTRIAQEELASRTTMFIPGLTLESYNNGLVPIQGTITQGFDGRRWNFESHFVKATLPADVSPISDDGRWMQLTTSPRVGNQSSLPVYGRCIDVGRDDAALVH